MQTDNPIISDFVKLLNSAAGTLAGVGREGRDAARERAREIFGGMDFVGREEFEAVKALPLRRANTPTSLRRGWRRWRPADLAVVRSRGNS